MKDITLYGIRNKITKDVWKTNRNKYFWKTTGAAKNAYIGQEGRYSYQAPRAGWFDDPRCEYEVYVIGRLVWEPPVAI